MRKINKEEEPGFWKEYKRLHPRDHYRDLEKSAQGTMLRYRLRKYLLQSQYGLCAYCCRRIETEDSLNEHVRPQSSYPNESMNYNNLVVSCKTEGVNATCGVKKGNDYSEKLLISPLESDCEEKFIFYPNGQIDGMGEEGRYTCSLLNLNAYELQRARLAQYKTCASYGDSELIHDYFLLPDREGKLEAYADMIQFFYDRGHFGVEER